MRRFCDLHCHSLASDGSSRPAEVVAMAERRGLAALALTDHDTVAGLAEAARAAAALPSLAFIPGIEVSAAFDRGTLHILGLCVDAESPELSELSARLREARNARNPVMVERLRGLGIDMTLAEWRAAAGGPHSGDPVVGRLQLAELMARKGIVKTTKEAFDRYIGHGRPAYVDKERLSPAEVIADIHACGGLAILAHPVQLGYSNYAECERIVRSLMAAGLDGIEVYHSQHSDADTRFLLDLARKHKLAISGGSDFHGSAKPDVHLGRPRVPAEVAEALLARAAAKR
jgi:predicted metal-dependent phosphoesterase TrpH